MKNGMTESARKDMAQELSKILASMYTLYLKTQNFHWNVVGPHFQTLHTMFEGQYNELFMANDEVAERIRALGEFAPGSYSEFARLSFISEANGHPKAEDMVKQLLEDHETLVSYIRDVMEKAADARDEATNDVLAPRIDAHEKTAWMLRSFLG